MKQFRENIWQENEYTFRAAYGFVPNIHAYLHEDEEIRDCLLVLPGGGYCMCVPHEGELVAKEFYERGMNVFVLTYSTDITFSIPLKKQPLNDISRAVRFIRKRAGEYNIEGKKLFICGFSAGAHVCGSLATHYDEVEDAAYSGISNRPDGVILSYPVITTGDYTHGSSVEALLGKNPEEAELEYFSLEKNVKDNTPPCFIWQTQTDELVPVENSYLFAEALRKKKIPFAHYVFPEGFHGLSVPNEEFFNGFKGGEYTMEQVMKAVAAVKEGKGVNVPETRVQELKEQFADENKEESENKGDLENEFNPFAGIDPLKLFKDVRLWPDLAMEWMDKI